MNLAIRKFFDVLENPFFVTANIVAASGLSLLMILSRPGHEISYYKIIGLCALVAIIFLTYIYSIKVRSENIALKCIAEEFYEINQIYRKKIHELHLENSDEIEIGGLVAEEMMTLRGVCQRISHIYERVVGRKCIVTIKLITIENDECFAHTYVRSEELCVRDFGGRVKYKVDKSENSGFYEALMPRSDGKPPHFFSGDLTTDGQYKNQRKNFNFYYRSALVVPIGDMVVTDNGEQMVDGLVGFLCVDSLSVNRLNNRYHLFMLSALSSQMYTFISFVRGKYRIIS